MYYGYEVGDIVLVSKYRYSNNQEGTLHYFVVMDVVKDEITLVDLEYLCFLISSNTSKNRDVNSNYPYNEPIHPDKDNRLRKSGHVKCDELIKITNKDDIIMRIGMVTPEQYNKFVELYKQSMMSADNPEPCDSK